MVKWRVYYGDKTTFSSDDGSPQDAPPWNVQTIVQPHIESGRYLLPPYDYYIWRDERWIGVDACGLADHLVHLGILKLDSNFRKKLYRNGQWHNIDDVDLVMNMADMGLALMGRTIRTEDFLALIQIAQEDPDFPRRTAYRKEDWRPEMDQSR